MAFHLLHLAAILTSIIVVKPYGPPATQPAVAARSTCLAEDPYDVIQLEGWTVKVNQRLSKGNPELAAKAVELLKFQLYQVEREVPKPALAKIRGVVIWVELNDPLFPGACYHSNFDWVKGNGLNPDKTHGVEIANARNFLQWEHTQPWMVLHELSHAYHDQFLPGGFENEKIRAAYDNARNKKLYESVLRNNGHVERAYAMTNQMEYFAECSEAFFGTNDFYPFVRVEFAQHDPVGYEALRELWGDRRGPATQPANEELLK